MEQTILVIEDHSDVRENIRELLVLAGYNVSVATNGKEGIAQAKICNPDLILCDIMMPELDGYGVLRVIDSLPEMAGTPFVFVTAKTDREDFRKAMDLGADDYLTKPFEGDELLRVVEARIKKGRLLRKKFTRAAGDVETFFTESGELLGKDVISVEKSIKKFKKKDVIYLEGDSASYLYYLVNGKVKTYRTNDLGKEYITNILNKEEFFGYIQLLEGNARTDSAAALEDSEMWIIPKEEFFKLLYSNIAISVKFIRLITDNLEDAETRLLDLAYNSARKKVADALIFIGSKYGLEEGKPMSINRETISSVAGIAQESVSRNLSDFKEEGIIATDNGNIKILSLKKLESVRT